MTAVTQEDGATAAKPGFIRLIAEDIDGVMARDPAARSRIEVLLTYPGVHAVLFYRLANPLWRRGLRFPARFLSFLARMMTNVDIHPGATIGRRLFIDHGAGVVIGETAEIGDDVLLFHGVTLGGTARATNKGKKRHPTLGSNVLIGAGAKILGPITVHDGAAVGANSVVIADVPAGMTAVGMPAKPVLPRALRPVDAGDPAVGADPVGAAIQCLLERVTDLELRLAAAQAGQSVPGPAIVAHPVGHGCDARQAFGELHRCPPSSAEPVTAVPHGCTTTQCATSACAPTAPEGTLQ